MLRLKEIRDSILHVVFPHVCDGCGSDLLNVESNLCIRCLYSLPQTNFEKHAGNPVEKLFWGRMQLVNASASFYFTKESLMQQLMHQFKYRRNKDLGLQLGRIMGKILKSSGKLDGIDALIPLPLYPKKERKRGYNQATVLCEGIAEICNLPVLKKVISRPQHTDTQTKKGRIDRWQNIEGKFLLRDTLSIQDKHLLLIDDVVTTGATLEACGNELLIAGGVKLSIATLCVASR